MFFKKCLPIYLIGFFFMVVAVDIGFCQQAANVSPDGKFLDVLHEYPQTKDSIIGREKNQTIAFQKAGYDVDEFENGNKHLEFLNTTNRRVIDQQRLILVVVFAAFLAAIFAWLRLRKLFWKVKVMNQQIALQNDELAELNGIKSKVFSVIAHDLRNPLTQLMAVMQLIENDVIGPDELGTLIPSLNKSVYQTLHITDNLLMWAKSQMNGFRIKPESINLDQLSKEVIDNLSEQLGSKKLTVDTIALERQSAWADVEMVRIVVRNLLTNAVKFTPSGGIISLALTGQNDFITLEISDSGVGMTDAQLQNLFSFDTKCTRGTDNERGSGLGLKICADLLKINNGSICVKSELGRGTTFFVGLPCNANSTMVLPVADQIFAAAG